MEGHRGDRYDEALSTLAELEDIGWKVRLCLIVPTRAELHGAQGATGRTLEQARESARRICTAQ